MSSNSTNSLLSGPSAQVIENLLGLYAYIASMNTLNAPGYSNVEIGNYVANLAATMTVGTSGVAIASYANLSGNSTNPGIANAIFLNI